MPHVRKPQPLIIAGEDPVAVRGRDELTCGAEPAVGVLERALGEAEGEGRADIVGLGDEGASFVEHGSRLADPARRDEVVEQARQVTGAHHLRDIGEHQRGSPGGDPDLG